MTTDSIIITAATFKSLPQSVRNVVLQAVFGAEQNKSAEGIGSIFVGDDDELAQLSPSQAREFYSGCGEKTRKALEVMANSESREFHLADVAKAVGVKPAELTGVWGGLTRRLYTITGTKSGHLINWTKHDGVFDEYDEYIDHVGELSELTYQSLRKILIK